MADQVKVNAQQYAQRWGTGLKGSIPRVREGVERVTESPGVAAAAAKDKWHQRMSSTAVADKWARRVGAMTLPAWQQAMLTKGVNRISDGVDGATDKMVAYAEKMIPHQNRLLAEVHAMPNVTLEDAIARQAAWTRGMAQLIT